MTTTNLVPWQPSEPLALVADSRPLEIVEHAAQLSGRDQHAIAMAFDSGAYEMAAMFVWTKALTSLKKQLAGLGMEFVGEMLGRTDLTETSNPVTEVREDEALELAEQLGMVSATEAIRLHNSQKLLTHFADPEAARDEQLMPEEAISILRSCVINFLAEPGIHTPHGFLELRQKLQSEAFSDEAPELENLANSPYFYVRTTLTVLLTQLKTSSGASLEHAAGNIGVLLPIIWSKIREKDRWQTGETYAMVHAGNQQIAAQGLRAALMKVKGFDYVPETLRSNTYRTAAREVLTAHLGLNNFYTEPKPMRALAKLGSSIPHPAVGDCFTAALCVALGNRYGVSFDAQPAATQLLDTFRQNQWEYYLNKLLHADRHILEKLAYEQKPVENWQKVISDFDLEDLSMNSRIQKLVTSKPAKRNQIRNQANHLREKLMQEA